MNKQNGPASSDEFPSGIVRSPRSSPPIVTVEPSRFLGHIVQVALNRDQAGRPTRLLPPLRVVSYSLASGKPEERYGPDIYFIGEPLRRFLASEAEFRDDFSYVSHDSLFMFFSVFDNLQPHFCADPLFLKYLEREGEYITVEVYNTSMEKVPGLPGFASRVEDYEYLDVGVLQVFVPGRGFVGKWPGHYPHLEKLRRIEQVHVDDRSLTSEGEE